MGSRRKDAAHGIPADRNFFMAVAFMMTAAALNAVDTLLVRVISTEMSAFSIAFFRSAFGLLFVAPWLWRHRARIAATNYRWMHVLRAGLKVLALAAFLYVVVRLGLFDRPLDDRLGGPQAAANQTVWIGLWQVVSQSFLTGSGATATFPAFQLQNAVFVGFDWVRLVVEMGAPTRLGSFSQFARAPHVPELLRTPRINSRIPIGVSA